MFWKIQRVKHLSRKASRMRHRCYRIERRAKTLLSEVGVEIPGVEIAMCPALTLLSKRDL